MSNYQYNPQQDRQAAQFVPAPPKPKKSKGWIFWSIGVFIALMIGVAIGGGGAETTAVSSTPAPTKTITVAPKAGQPIPTVTTTVTVPAPAPATSEAVVAMGDGTYEVGADIKPGKYKTVADDTCYWARLKNTEGDLNSIIVNHLGGGQQTVTIKSTDGAFESRGCGDWTKIG